MAETKIIDQAWNFRGTLQKDGVDITSNSETATLTNKTLTAPTIAAGALSGTFSGTPTFSGAYTSSGNPVFSGNPSFTGDPTGIPVVKQGVLTENSAATSYTLTIPVPAGATIHDILVIPRVLWNGTSAALDVGDTADPNGFFAAIDLKATDAVIGEMFSVMHGDLWGGKNGAYLVAATGQRGATTSNFAMYYAAGSDITFVVTPGAADGSAGRTQCVVIYSVGELIAQVVV